MEDICFSDGRVLAFFRSWNLGRLLLLCSKLFLLAPAPIQANTRGGDQNMQGIGFKALKISLIEKRQHPTIGKTQHCHTKYAKSLNFLK